MNERMYLRLGQELVDLKQDHDAVIQEIRRNPENTKELRERVEQIAIEIVEKQKFFNQLLNPKHYDSRWSN